MRQRGSGDEVEDSCLQIVLDASKRPNSSDMSRDISLQ